MRLRAILLFLAACSAPAFNGGVWKLGDAQFRIGPKPETWRQVETMGTSAGFRDDPHEASVLVGARCKISSDDAPLLSLTNHLIMGTTEREFVSQDVIPFDGREAMHTVLRAKLDGVLMSYDVYVLKKDMCVYDFVYVAEPKHFEAGAPAFERFVSGFHTTE
jgi:hypothetical protein